MSQVVIPVGAEMPAHSSAYRWRRFMNWFPLGLTYAFLYMARYNLNAAKIALAPQGLMTDEQFGSIFGIGAAVYGISFLVNGPLTDRIGGKRAMLISSFGAALMNSLMGLVTYLVIAKHATFSLYGFIALTYALNMYFQSYGAVAIVKVNAHWFHVRERGKFGGIFGVLISLGLYFAYDWSQAIVNATVKVGTPVVAQLGLVTRTLRRMLGASTSTIDQTWWVFFVPAAILGFFFILNILLVRDRPGQAGFSDFDTGDADSGKDEGQLKVKQLLAKILTNPVILTIACIEFCSGAFRDGISQWFKLYNTKYLGLDVANHNFFFSNWGLLLMLAGIFGGIFAGYVSDLFFGSRRGPVTVFLYSGMILVAIAMSIGVAYGMTPDKTPVLSMQYLLGAGAVFGMLCVIGVHGMLSGTATMDFGGRKAAATAVGIIDGFVYLGSSLQAICIGKIVEGHGYAYWPPFLLPFTLIGLFLAIRIWNAFPNATRRKRA